MSTASIKIYLSAPDAAAIIKETIEFKGRDKMITQIGITAGEIWNYLDEHNEAKVETLIDDLKKENTLVLMSLGWLAREGHINFTDKEGISVVSLRK
jgi:hypothetical protein